MELGAFSVSLTVKDLSASIAFYKMLGFEPPVMPGGAAFDPTEHGYAILKNGNAVIGLFQGMFDKNILTFNPGWDQSAQDVNPFTDVRELQKKLKAQGVKLATEADETTTGPASFTLEDPDGNPILIDQHR